MGARPSSFRKGGGFLNNVDGVIAGYEFTDVFPGGSPKKRSKSDFHSLFCVLSARVDGADEDVTTSLFVGNADEWEISEDGHTLTPLEDGQELGGNTGFAKFISSLVEAGFPETNLPENEFNYEPIIGTRVRFIQRVDVETTKKLGKRKSKDGKKEYDRTDVVVDQVYELAQLKGKARKAVKSAATKPNGKAIKASPPDAVDIAETASLALLGYLEAAKDNQLAKSKVRMKVLTDPQFKGNTELRDDVIKWLYNDDNLEGIDEITYAKTDKNQVIELSA